MDLKHRSRNITDGRDRAPARAMYKGIGFTDDDLAKPLIAVANTWIETMPCNFHLRRLSAKVKEGIRAAGGTPMEFNTIAISDGETMGTEGMRASLVSREVIADSIELVCRGQLFDAAVCIVGCDKTIPAAAMALARMNLPGLVLYGGTIAPGKYRGKDVTIQDVFEAVGANAAGKMSDADLHELGKRGVSRGRRLRRAVHSQHHEHGDGTDRALADGLQRNSGDGSAQRRSLFPLRRSCDESSEKRYPPERHPDPSRLRQRHRGGCVHRRIHQCGAAPAGHCARSGSAAAYR